MQTEQWCGLDRLRHLGPRGRQTQLARDMGSQVREAILEVLDEGMAAAQDVSSGSVFETAHRIDALLEVLMVQLHGRLHLPFPVLADAERSVYAAYGLDRALHVIQRSATVLIDTQGLIRYLNRTTLPFDALNEAAVMAALAQAWMVGQPEPQPQTI